MQKPAVMNQFGQVGVWSMGHAPPLAAPMNQMGMGAGRMGQPNVVQLQNQYLPPGQFPGSSSGLVSAPVGVNQLGYGGMAHKQMEEARRMQLQKQGMMPVQPGMTSSGVPQGHSSMGHLPMAPGQPPMLNHSVHMGMQPMGQRSTHGPPLGAPMNQMAMGAGRMQYLPPGQFPGPSSGLVPGPVGMNQPGAHGGMAHHKVEEVRRMQLQKQGMMTPGQPPMMNQSVHKQSMGQRSTPPVPLGAPMNQMGMGAGRMGQHNVVQLQNQYLPPGQFPGSSSGLVPGPVGVNQPGAHGGMAHNKMEEVRRMQLQKQGMMPVQPGMPPSGLPQGHSAMGHQPMASRQPPSVPNADPYISRTTRANKMINGMQNPAGAYGL